MGTAEPSWPMQPLWELPAPPPRARHRLSYRVALALALTGSPCCRHGVEAPLSHTCPSLSRVSPCPAEFSFLCIWTDKSQKCVKAGTAVTRTRQRRLAACPLEAMRQGGGERGLGRSDGVVDDALDQGSVRAVVSDHTSRDDRRTQTWSPLGGGGNPDQVLAVPTLGQDLDWAARPGR